MAKAHAESLGFELGEVARSVEPGHGQVVAGRAQVLPDREDVAADRSEVMEDGEELFADIERGKTLVIVNQATSAPDAQGMVTAFFELNGQPRRIKVPDRAHGGSGSAVRAKADIGNPLHLGAPMPGVISRVFVASGQAVKAGDVLVSIEAMKMETALHAEKDGTLAEVLVKAGDQIDAKDLLVVYGS